MERDFFPEGKALLRRILWNRGVRTTEEAHLFLDPKLKNFIQPHALLKDLDEALKILLKAREQRQLVVIYGDYDVDGTTSTALLVRSFEELGFHVEYFIPHRIEDGYGLNKKGGEKMLARYPNVKVVVTCDNGVGAFEGCEFLKAKGIQVIVTDHHEVPETRVSAAAVLNPKQKDCRYPEKRLAGVGVAFLLLMGLRRALNATDYSLQPFLDLVSVGTVCDVAPLLGQNRILVKAGLKKVLDSDFLGLRVLGRRAPNAQTEIKARDCGFFIGPRLNASGRIGHPEAGVKALLARSMEDAVRYCDELEAQNARRRQMQDEQLKEALQKVAKIFEKDPATSAFIVANSDFHLGIVGLIAGRVAEAFDRPACILTRIDDEHELAFHKEAKALWKGSLRAPLGFHLANALEDIRKLDPTILKSGGGHAQAAGVALDEDQLEKFQDSFLAAITAQARQAVEIPVDGEIDDLDEMQGLFSILEPFGQGNPAPMVRIRDVEWLRMRKMKEIHLKFWGLKSGKEFSVLQFQSPWVTMMETWGGGARVLLDIVGEVSENVWNGRTTTELILKDIVNVNIGGRVQDVRQQRSKTANALIESKSVS